MTQTQYFAMVLASPASESLLKSRNQVLTTFYLSNLSSLLTTAFEATDPLSTRAFQILTQSDPQLLICLFSGPLFAQVAVQHLSYPSPHPLTLYRIGHLSVLAIQLHPKSFPSCCGFLLQLLAFISELCVLYFFEHICGDDSTFAPTQEWLKSMQFPLLLSSEFIRPTDAPDEPERFANLFSLINHALKSRVLAPAFFNTNVFRALHFKMNELPSEVEAERWGAICAFCKAFPSHYSVGMLPIALDRVDRPIAVADRALVAALRTVTVLLRADDEVALLLASLPTNAAIFGLMRQFPGHTFLQRAAVQYAIAGLDCPPLRHALAADLVIPLIQQMTEMINPVLAGAVYAIVTHTMKVADGDRAFARWLAQTEYHEFVFVRMADRMALITNGYGGKI
jgi:hypothetical protein